MNTLARGSRACRGCGCKAKPLCSRKCHCKAAGLPCTGLCQVVDLVRTKRFIYFNLPPLKPILSYKILIIMVIFVVIKFIFLGRTIDVRGYPSEFFNYTPENACTKFHAFIRSVTMISIRDWTKKSVCR